jgi:hypothetical protein
MDIPIGLPPWADCFPSYIFPILGIRGTVLSGPYRALRCFGAALYSVIVVKKSPGSVIPLLLFFTQLKAITHTS